MFIFSSVGKAGLLRPHPCPQGLVWGEFRAGWAGLAASRLPNGRFGHRQSLWPGGVGWWLCSPARLPSCLPCGPSGGT